MRGTPATTAWEDEGNYTTPPLCLGFHFRTRCNVIQISRGRRSALPNTRERKHIDGRSARTQERGAHRTRGGTRCDDVVKKEQTLACNGLNDLVHTLRICLTFGPAERALVAMAVLYQRIHNRKARHLRKRRRYKLHVIKPAPRKCRSRYRYKGDRIRRQKQAAVPLGSRGLSMLRRIKHELGNGLGKPAFAGIFVSTNNARNRAFEDRRRKTTARSVIAMRLLRCHTACGGRSLQAFTSRFVILAPCALGAQKVAKRRTTARARMHRVNRCHMLKTVIANQHARPLAARTTGWRNHLKRCLPQPMHPRRIGRLVCLRMQIHGTPFHAAVCQGSYPNHP